MAKSKKEEELQKDDELLKEEPKHEEVKSEPQYEEVEIPVGGLAELAASLWPGDAQNAEKHAEHVNELWQLNRDRLRTAESHQVGQKAKVPAHE